MGVLSVLQTKTTQPFILASFISLPKMGVSAAAKLDQPRKVKKLDRTMIKILTESSLYPVGHLDFPINPTRTGTKKAFLRPLAFFEKFS